MPNFLLCSSKYRLHRYDSFFRLALLLSGYMNVKSGPTTVKNNKLPLNVLLFYNCDEPAMSPECDSSDSYKERYDSKL